jgi:hypothetical protein
VTRDERLDAVAAQAERLASEISGLESLNTNRSMDELYTAVHALSRVVASLAREFSPARSGR